MDDLRPEDVLGIEPRAQYVALKDGRLLVRHPAGITVVRGVREGDLDKLCSKLEAPRTVGAVCEALSAEYDPEGVLDVLSTLTGKLFRRESCRKAELSSFQRFLVVGNGPGSAQLAKLLEHGGSEMASDHSRSRGLGPRIEQTTPDRLESKLTQADFVLCLLEGVSYRDLFRIQTSCLEDSVPILFVTFDPEGVHIGPVIVPGRAPCFGCAQIDRF